MTKPKFIALLLSLLCTASLSFAQQEQKQKIVIGLYSFDYLRGVDKLYPLTISGHIAEKVSCYNNVELLDKSTFPVLGEALEDSKSVESALEETVEQGRRKGAETLITGFITSVEQEYVYESKTFRVSIIMDISTIDIQSGVANTKQFIFEGGNNIGMLIDRLPIPVVSTEEVLRLLGEKGINKAIEKSFNNLDRELVPFLSKHFGDYDPVCMENTVPSSGVIPFDKIPFPEIDRDAEYTIVNRDTDKTLLIKTPDNGMLVKNLSKFDIMRDFTEEDLQGNIITRPELLAYGKFKGLSGEYAVIEIHKKSEKTVDELVSMIKGGEDIYVMRKQKKQAN